MQYRIYLLGPKDHIQAGEGFLATDDNQAARLAADAYAITGEKFSGYELWSGSRFVTRSLDGVRQPWPPARRLDDARQERLAVLEERLAQSFDCIRSSREIMERIDGLRNGEPANQ
jgi:hypothetical protein